ncbi:MAG TPA: TraB/GumN family protein, partial [Saprospiraceae bacterium]|nr:TraB/GumN family protein [Saprospiraceae bacterium]
MTASSLLWQLIPPQGQPHWLFGSMHIRDNRVYQFGEKLYPLISDSDVYVGEMELEQQPELI